MHTLHKRSNSPETVQLRHNAPEQMFHMEQRIQHIGQHPYRTEHSAMEYSHHHNQELSANLRMEEPRGHNRTRVVQPRATRNASRHQPFRSSRSSRRKGPTLLDAFGNPAAIQDWRREKIPLKHRFIGPNLLKKNYQLKKKRQQKKFCRRWR